MKRSFLFLLPLITATVFFSPQGVFPVCAVQRPFPDYSLWEAVLEKYVNGEGRVDYAALKKERDQFDRFIDQVENADIRLLSPAEQKAFWINAYNAVTMKVVLDHYPVKSIRLIDFGLVWNVGRKVAGGNKSLGDIEHKILRPMGDPRIHFAINCASIGCPKLPKRPFYPETLEEQLEEEARRFINDPQKVYLDRTKNVLYHSAIFEWFREDFLAVSADLTGYIKKYINGENKRYLEEHPRISLQVFKYNWDLNQQ